MGRSSGPWSRAEMWRNGSRSGSSEPGCRVGVMRSPAEMRSATETRRASEVRRAAEMGSR